MFGLRRRYLTGEGIGEVLVPEVLEVDLGQVGVGHERVVRRRPPVLHPREELLYPVR